MNGARELVVLRGLERARLPSERVDVPGPPRTVDSYRLGGLYSDFFLSSLNQTILLAKIRFDTVEKEPSIIFSSPRL